MDKLLTDSAELYCIQHLGDPELVEYKDVCDAFEAGAKWEASRHNSKCENNWQTLQAFRDAVSREWTLSTKMLQLVAMVDQCLLENKPETIVP